MFLESLETRDLLTGITLDRACQSDEFGCGQTKLGVIGGFVAEQGGSGAWQLINAQGEIADPPDENGDSDRVRAVDVTSIHIVAGGHVDLRSVTLASYPNVAQVTVDGSSLSKSDIFGGPHREVITVQENHEVTFWWNSGGDDTLIVQNGSDAVRLDTNHGHFRLSGTARSPFSHRFASTSTGDLSYTDTTKTTRVIYTGVSSIADQVDAPFRGLVLTDTDDIATLTVNGTTATLTGSLPFSFRTPTAELLFRGLKGKDRLTIETPDPSLLGQLTVRGDEGDDTLDASNATVDLTLMGDDDADWLLPGRGSDRLEGGNGPDRYLFGPNWGLDFVFGDAEDTIDMTPTQVPLEFLVGDESSSDILVLHGEENTVVNRGGNVGTLIGSTQDDLFLIDEGQGWLGQGSGLIHGGGGGVDTLSFATWQESVFVDLLTPPPTGGVGTGHASKPSDDGIETLFGIHQIANVLTGAGHDRIAGNTSDNLLDGGDGNDTYIMRDAWGSDVIRDSHGFDTLEIDSQRSIGFSLSSTEQVRASDGTHIVSSDATFEQLFGGHAGDEFLFDNPPLVAAIDGRGGIDTLDYRKLAGPVEIDIYLGDQNGKTVWKASGDHFSNATNVENYLGTPNPRDRVSFSTVNRPLHFDIDASGVAVKSNAVSAAIQLNNWELVKGGPLDDTFVVHPDAALAATLDGERGEDTLDYSRFTSAIQVDLALGTASAVQHIVSMENVIGGSAADRIVGDDNPNELSGGPGNDFLDGEDAFDVLDGGDDRDVCRNGEEVFNCEELDIVAVSLLPNAAAGGIDYTFAVPGLPATDPFDIAFFWADGPDPLDSFAEAFRATVPADTETTAAGTTIHLPSRLLAGFSPRATHLVMLVDAWNSNDEHDENNNFAVMPIVFDITAQNARWEGGGVSFEVVTAGPPVTTAALTTLQLTWGRGGAPLGSVVHAEPVFWSNQPQWIHFDQLTGRPADATQLLVLIDPDNELAESDEQNNIHPLPLRVVNVVTHGFGSILPGFHDSWSLLEQELNRLPQAGSDLEGSVQTIRHEWDSSSGWIGGMFAFLNSVMFDRAAAINDSLNVLLKIAFPWSIERLRQLSELSLSIGRSFMAEARSHAEQAAREIVARIDSDPRLSKIGAEVIHLVGHSRGGAVNARVAELLTEEGYFIEQFTSLDGYSIDWPGGSNVLADFDIAGKVGDAGNSIGRSVNYRVEEGLDEVLINLAPSVTRSLLSHVDKLGLLGAAAVGFSPALGDLLRSAGIGWKAPVRNTFDINTTITGPTANSPPSNHVNLVSEAHGGASGYYLQPRYLHDNFLGEHRDVRSTNRHVSGNGEPATPQLSQFFDPDFSFLGGLQDELANLDLEDSGDPLVESWMTILREATTPLTTVWHVDGDVSLVDHRGGYGMRLAHDSTDVTVSQATATQSRLLENSVGHLVFDVDIQHATAGDQLHVLFDGQIVHTLNVESLESARVTLPIYSIAGAFGEFGVGFSGTTDTAAVVVDDLLVTPYAHNPVTASDINDDGRVNILDLANLAANLRSLGFRTIDFDTPPLVAPQLFVDATADGRASLLDLVTVINRIRAIVGGGEGEPEEWQGAPQLEDSISIRRFVDSTGFADHRASSESTQPRVSGKVTSTGSSSRPATLSESRDSTENSTRDDWFAQFQAEDELELLVDEMLAPQSHLRRGLWFF